MEITILQGLWFCLVFLLIAIYFVLDGFDLGAGVLSPFVAKSEDDMRVVRRALGPVWDGNEVWLLTAGGALFAAFPAAYATTFSGFYLAVMLVLFGLIVRAVSFEFRAGDPKWAKLWDVCFFVGSLLPALLLGVAVGNIYAGIPMAANGDYNGVPLLGLITPFTLLTGLLGLSMFLLLGACWLSLKAERGTGLQERCAKLRLPLAVVALVLFVCVSAYGHFIVQPDMEAGLSILRWVFAILFVVAAVGAVMAGTKGCDIGAFVCAALGAVALVGLLAASMFPNFVVASVGSIGGNITAMNAASGELTLAWMTGIACVFVPIVLCYHVLVYYVFRGRITKEDLSH